MFDYKGEKPSSRVRQLKGQPPFFPPVARPTYTLITDEESLEEGYKDDLQKTVLGETYNNSEISPDSLYIFIPDCKEESAGVFRFQFEFSGDVTDFRVANTYPAKEIPLVELFTSGDVLLERLLKTDSQFQFVAAPGTDREQRYRVAQGGKLQKLSSRVVGTPFRLVWVDHGPVITARHNPDYETIRWMHDDDKDTGERSKAWVVKLKRETLEDLADIFYALQALDEEAMALYGRIVGLCGMCGRDLADAASLSRGVGPSCWKKLTAEAKP